MIPDLTDTATTHQYSNNPYGLVFTSYNMEPFPETMNVVEILASVKNKCKYYETQGYRVQCEIFKNNGVEVNITYDRGDEKNKMGIKFN
jgi:hypothetical protein